MGKNKCSICGAELGNLDDLIIHEAEHESGCSREDFEGPNADNVKAKLSGISEFEGDYVGGHIDYPDPVHTTLKLHKDKIEALDYSNNPFLSIPYKRIKAIQVLSEEQMHSFFAIGNNLGMLALTAGISILADRMWSSKKLFLVIAFEDEADIEQSVAFDLREAAEAQCIIYDKVAQAKKKRKAKNKQ